MSDAYPKTSLRVPPLGECVKVNLPGGTWQSPNLETKRSDNPMISASNKKFHEFRFTGHYVAGLGDCHPDYSSGQAAPRKSHIVRGSDEGLAMTIKLSGARNDVDECIRHSLFENL